MQLYRVCFQEHQQFPLILVGINVSQIFSADERADSPSDRSWIFSSKINGCILSASGQDKTFQICPNLVFTWDIFCAFDFEIKFKSALDQLYCPYDHTLPHTGFAFSYYRVYTCSMTSLTPFIFRQLLVMMAIYNYANAMPILTLPLTALQNYKMILCVTVFYLWVFSFLHFHYISMH